MKKNVAGQKIGAQMVSATDGSAFTGSVTCYVCGDAGTQAVGSVGSGACTHKGNGYHTYAPAQAETDYNLIAFTFIGSGAVPVTVQVFTSYPQTGDAYARLGTPSGVSISADVAAVKAETAAIFEDTGTTLDDKIDAIDDFIDTEVAAIKAKTDLIPASPAATGDIPSAATVASQVRLELASELSHLDASVSTRSTYAGGDTSGVTTLLSRIIGTLATGTHNPQSGDAYARLGAPDGASISADVASIKTDTGTTIPGRLPTALTAGGNIKADLLAISGDGTAADNAEAFFDGTGYLGLNNTIAFVGSVLGNVDGSVGSVIGNVGGNLDGSVRGNVDGSVGSVIGNVGGVAANGIGASSISSAGLNAIADAILKRDWTAVTGEASRSLLNALRFLRNKWSVSGATLTVTKEDDATTAWTAALSTDAAADPVIGSDPA